jgi:hypothetical protein
VIAFRSFESRGKNLSLAQCVRVVHLDYTGCCKPDSHSENEVYVIASVVELVLIQKGDAPDGVSDTVRQAWRELTSIDAPPELVMVATRSVWRAQDEKQFGGRYGDKPSGGCKGIGIHRDEISPWQENAIRALEEGTGDA